MEKRELKRDAQGRFVRTTPNYKLVASRQEYLIREIEHAFWELLEYCLKHRLQRKKKIADYAIELMEKVKTV